MARSSRDSVSSRGSTAAPSATSIPSTVGKPAEPIPPAALDNQYEIEASVGGEQKSSELTEARAYYSKKIEAAREKLNTLRNTERHGEGTADDIFFDDTAWKVVIQYVRLRQAQKKLARLNSGDEPLVDQALKSYASDLESDRRRDEVRGTAEQIEARYGVLPEAIYRVGAPAYDVLKGVGNRLASLGHGVQRLTSRSTRTPQEAAEERGSHDDTLPRRGGRP